ncbi:hypothetical protein [Vitiosangium sp. GDMCC 1.1324]|uniref:hypothetical protein n=1 Tax=Vitiosangium sp. (strain GDMCC 1.1324) TaxID=2138576 RepID=UPI000D367934|nr:hypothetical protein [Vitiosangium sp. GDMCC 1.1324]PTL82648.1 hypothetical protein DAT35_17810 [Vitiosangium sp. GDMCC 1.1324]
MTYINMTTGLLNATYRLLAESAKNPVEVGLLMRWNEDDRYLWTIWSEAYHPGIVTSYSSAGMRRDVGGHAEEILIKNWRGYEQEAGFRPRIVDLILTKLPCFMTSNAVTLGTRQLPVGCAGKLKVLIEEIQPGVLDWRLAYFRELNPGPNSDIENGGSLSLLSTIQKLSVYSFLDHHSFVAQGFGDGLTIA